MRLPAIPYESAADAAADSFELHSLSERSLMLILSQTGALHWSEHWYHLDRSELSPSELEDIEDWASKAEDELLVIAAEGSTDVEAPYWDDADGGDAPDELPADEQPWYEQLADWAVTAFLAVSFGPDAAVSFVTTAQKLRIFFRTRDYGAIAQIFMDDDPVATVDTYSPEPGLTYVDIPNPGTTLKIVHSGTHNEAATPTDDGYAIEIVRKRLYADEVQNPNQRLGESGQLQTTNDGGTTWVDTPDADPRVSDSFLLPPLTGDDARCDAAARMTAALKESIDGFLGATTATEFAVLMMQLILHVIGLPALFLGPLGWLFDLFILVFDALVIIGSSGIAAAFTTEVYDDIQCIIYARISDDGSMNQAQYDAILAAIAAAHAGTVYNTIVQAFSMFGHVGFSNASVERTETGDCSSCTFPAWRWRFKDWDYATLAPWGGNVDQFGAYTPAEGRSLAGAIHDGKAYCSLVTNGRSVIWLHLYDIIIPADATITAIDFHWGGGNTDTIIKYFQCYDMPYPGSYITNVTCTTTCTGLGTGTVALTARTIGIDLGMNANSNQEMVKYIDYVDFYGTGRRLFGDHDNF